MKKYFVKLNNGRMYVIDAKEIKYNKGIMFLQDNRFNLSEVDYVDVICEYNSRTQIDDDTEELRKAGD